MAESSPASARGGAGGSARRADRQLTFAEIARREQLIGATIDVIAERGLARTSLQNIADAASITKAAVIYHFSTKNEVIRAAYTLVRTGLVTHMQATIAAAPTPGEAVRAYLAGQLDYLAANPTHVRVMVECLSDPEIGIQDRDDTAARWRPLADLIARAQEAGQYDPSADSRAHAIIFGGAVDSLVAETINDPEFSLADGSAALVNLVATLQDS